MKHIKDADDIDRVYKLDQWALLFTATTWEELKNIAKEDPYMEATISEMRATIKELQAEIERLKKQ